MNPYRPAAVLFIGGSAGSFALMRDLLAPMGPKSPPAIVVLHHAQSTRADVPSIAESLGGSFIEHGQPLVPGKVHVVPADYHAYVERDGTLSLSVDPPVCNCRPSLDVTMQSIARIFGPKATAIVLSGANNDGAAGAVAISERGGQVFVQDPASALFPLMPNSVLLRVSGAITAPPAALTEIVRTLVLPGQAME